MGGGGVSGREVVASGSGWRGRKRSDVQQAQRCGGEMDVRSVVDDATAGAATSWRSPTLVVEWKDERTITINVRPCLVFTTRHGRLGRIFTVRLDHPGCSDSPSRFHLSSPLSGVVLRRPAILWHSLTDMPSQPTPPGGAVGRVARTRDFRAFYAISRVYFL